MEHHKAIKQDAYMAKNKHMIMLGKNRNLTYYQLKESDIEKFTSFIYQVYAKEYKEKYNWNPESSCYDEMIAEDRKYAPYANHYICYDQQAGIIGACRITKKSGDTVFPIETSFHVKLDYLLKGGFFDIHEVWHFGRLAIDKQKIREYNLPVSSREILSNLLFLSLSVVCRDKNNLLISEIDYNVFRLMNQLGINMEIVGMPKFYIGSNTFPAIVTAFDLSDWLKEHDDSYIQHVS